MSGMSGDDLDLSAVAADAALLDALAAGSADDLDDSALAGLSALRTALDDDLLLLLLTSTPAPLQAAPAGDVVALRRPTGRRSGQRAAVLLAGAALALSSTGVAAATYESRPGDPFYGLRTAVAGPRAEDPDLLRKRLDVVQQQLRSPDAATRSTAREELAQVAVLLSELDPGLRGDLEQRHATLVERLADPPPASTLTGDAPSTDEPTGPPAVQTGPPTAPPGRPTETPRRSTETPTQGRTPESRPEPTREAESDPPAQQPTATPTAEEERPSPQTTRPSPRTTSSVPQTRPSPRSTQQAPGSRPAPQVGQPDDAGQPSAAPTDELIPPG